MVLSALLDHRVDGDAERALALLRLITNSNLLACATGNLLASRSSLNHQPWQTRVRVNRAGMTSATQLLAPTKRVRLGQD
jgi:hypothetical protein